MPERAPASISVSYPESAGTYLTSEADSMRKSDSLMLVASEDEYPATHFSIPLVGLPLINGVAVSVPSKRREVRFCVAPLNVSDHHSRYFSHHPIRIHRLTLWPFARVPDCLVRSRKGFYCIARAIPHRSCRNEAAVMRRPLLATGCCQLFPFFVHKFQLPVFA